MHKIYILKNSVGSPDEAFKDIGKKLFTQLKGYTGRTFVSIIYMEHDLRTATGMDAEDALKAALENHDITLGYSDTWKYARQFAEDKVSALNHIMMDMALEPGRFGNSTPGLDYAFELIMGTVGGNKHIVEIYTECEEYLNTIREQPYIDIEIDNPVFPANNLKSDVHEYFSLVTMSRQEMENMGKEFPVEKQYRSCMALGNKRFTEKAAAIPEWNEIDMTTNPDTWLDEREKIAAKLLDEKTWVEILEEPTGFNMDKGDIKKAAGKLAAPLRGILMNRPFRR